ncbi:hypothetical protein HQ585_10715 [candidate division KSB1 bacterium]|nr:hypothetical protein [candidate division KSB1 bacterium]
MKIKLILSLLVLGLLSGMVLAQSAEYAIEDIEFEAISGKPLEVLIRVDAGEVTIEKSSVPEKGSVNLEYMAEKFKSKLEFDPKRNRLKISVSGKGWHTWSKWSDENNGSPAVIKVLLPSTVDIKMDVRLKAGEMTQYLGGLRITEFHLSNWAGEVDVSFDEPNPTTMVFFDVDLRAGEARFGSLGNAHFEKADINGGIGELEVDFTGDLIQKSQARVDMDIGEALIILPADVGTRLQIGGSFSFLSEKDIDSDFSKRNRYYYSNDYEEAEKKFAIKVTPGLGELQIDRE